MMTDHYNGKYLLDFTVAYILSIPYTGIVSFYFPASFCRLIRALQITQLLALSLFIEIT
jgi:hypothetical protein